MLDVSAANAALTRVYESAWPALSAVVRETPGASGAHLVRIPEGLADVPVRVAVVGQQTAEWGRADTAEVQLKYYPADGGIGDRKHTPFWRATRQVVDALTEREGVPVVWTNLVAVDVNKKQAPPDVRDAVRAAVPPHGLLRHVLAAAQPDAVVFFTGPSGYYEWEVEQQFPGIERVPVDGQDTRALVRLEHEALPRASFRTYHPAYLQRRERWGLLDVLVEEARRALVL